MRAARFAVVSIIAGVQLAGCGGGARTSSPPPTTGAPSSLAYSFNPAVYARDVDITDNVPSSAGGAVTSYSVSPPLPAGLSLDGSTGVISGTPSAITAQATYTVTATNSAGSTTAGVVITVTDQAPSGLTYATNPAVYSQGLAVTSNLPSSTGGAVVSWSVSPPLPAGLSLDPYTGVVSGTPTAITALATYRVTATNSGGSDLIDLVITVRGSTVAGTNGTVAAGGSQTCALVNGGAECWGGNAHGQLGNGLTADSPVPVQVQGLTSGVQAIAAGGNHTCALVSGGVRCWGSNGHGQLGDNGSPADSPLPVQVQGLTSGVQAIAAGSDHTCALASGGVQCWGSNGHGQLGNGGSPTDSPVPVQVQGLTYGVQAVAAGGAHTCALVNGGVQCWGSNGNGQLGNDGTPTDSPVPVQVQELTRGVQALAAGFYHSCALANGGVQCWGYNGAGQLGNGAVADSHVPVQVTGLSSGVQAIAAGYEHTCALVNGAVKCWGSNSNGQLGNGSTADSHVPVQVTGLTSGVQAIAAGYYHTCALVNGGVLCWGQSTFGQVGDGSTTDRHTPVQVQGLTSGAEAVAAGFYHSCAVVNGGAQCWGYNNDGQLGNGSKTDSHAPVQVQGLASGVQAIAAGGFFTTALLDGGVWSWGNDDFGQLGNNSTTTRTTAAAALGLTSGVQAVAAGGFHAAALLDGGVRSWGRNNTGQLGNGSTSDSHVPVQVLSGGGLAPAAGASHSCALVDGVVECWGANGNGQLGIGSTADSHVPVQVAALVL